MMLRPVLFSLSLISLLISHAHASKYEDISTLLKEKKKEEALAAVQEATDSELEDVDENNESLLPSTPMVPALKRGKAKGTAGQRNRIRRVPPWSPSSQRG